MNGLWKNKLSGWNHKDSKRKSQNFNKYRKEKAKAILKNFSKDIRTPPKLDGRKKPYENFVDLEGKIIYETIYGKEIEGWEYYTFGLDGFGGSKHRKHISSELKAYERNAVNRYIHKGDWNAVMSYRGQKNTVSWDMS